MPTYRFVPGKPIPVCKTCGHLVWPTEIGKKARHMTITVLDQHHQAIAAEPKEKK